jgi:Flp pilus assembly pilin Flp
VTARLRGQRGQTNTEYAVVLSVITIGCIMVFAGLATSIVSAIARVAGLIP